MESKPPSRTQKIPSPEQIERKCRLSFGLFEAAFEIKKHQLSKKYPEKSERELSHMAMALFEKGAK